MRDIDWLKAYMEYKVEVLSKHDATTATELFDWGRDKEYFEARLGDIKKYREMLEGYVSRQLIHCQTIHDSTACPYCFFHRVSSDAEEVYCEGCRFGEINGYCEGTGEDALDWYTRMTSILCTPDIPLSVSIGEELHAWVKEHTER